MGTNLQILIVDDEEIVGRRLRTALEKQGYRVTVLQSGQAAIDLVRREEFDVVVADVRIDEVSGLDILDSVQMNWTRTKTILITGYATSEVARAAMIKGAFDCIAKPFKPRELMRMIEDAVRST